MRRRGDGGVEALVLGDAQLPAPDGAGRGLECGVVLLVIGMLLVRLAPETRSTALPS
ncbi:hypothetical protein [Streptomyces sp. NPDC058695]|uniref:hypothetical protein n=1 Tax=Streptomyces sp. NPDC058695 TaxID=3346604 RepID=UPI00364E1D0B